MLQEASPPVAATPAPVPRFPSFLLVPGVLGIVFMLLLVAALAFTWGTVHTIKQLTNPYIESSALIKGFFGRLSQGHVASQRQRYLRDNVAVGGLTFTKPSGWWVFGSPARIEGEIANEGDRIIDTVTLGIYFVDGAGRIEAGGDVLIPILIRARERQSFSLTAKETGFELPATLAGRQPIYRLIDCHFYEPPSS